MKKLKSVVLGVSVSLLLTSNVYAIPKNQYNRLIKGLNNYETMIVMPTKGITDKELVEEIRNLDTYNVNKIQLNRKGNKYYLYPDYLESKEQNNQAMRLASRIATETTGMKDKDKVMYITQRIANLIEYEESEEGIAHSPYIVFTGKGVCQGYARFADMVFKQAGIPCSLTLGTLGGAPHIWNNVEINGGLYAVDITASDMDEETNIIDWSYVFMTEQELKNKGYKITQTKHKLNTVPLKGKFNGEGLVSIKDQMIYTKVNKGLVGIPLNKQGMTKTLGLEDIEHHFVIGENLLTLSKEGVLKEYQGNVISNDVSLDMISTTGTGLYINGNLVYSPIILPLNRVSIINGGYKLKFKDKRYKIIEIDGKENVFYDNKFIIEIVGGN